MALTQIVNDGLGASLTATSEGGAVTTSIQQGLAKAWINFNGTTSGTTIRDSFNVSSNSDNASGDYTTTFTNAMSSADFSPNSFAGTGSVTAQAASQSLQGISTTTIRTLTYVRSAFDRAYTMNQTHGDLA